jgi:hypothetical protein
LPSFKKPAFQKTINEQLKTTTVDFVCRLLVCVNFIIQSDIEKLAESRVPSNEK